MNYHKWWLTLDWVFGKESGIARSLVMNDILENGSIKLLVGTWLG